MHRLLLIPLLLICLAPPAAVSAADDDKELRQQRREAAKERREQSRERDREIRDAQSELRDYARELQSDYRDRIESLKTEFELQRVELRSQREARVAEAQAEFTKQLQSSLVRQPGEEQAGRNLAELQKQAEAYAEELFRIRKAAAAELHAAEMDNLQQQHELLNQMDREILDQAKSLGLTDDISPVLAQAIGGELTEKEQRWNEKQGKHVEKLMAKNQRLLRPYRSGSALREWERDNRNQDFELEWQEQEELNRLEAMNSFYSLFMLQPGDGDAATSREELMNKLAEQQKQRELIRIKYKKLQDQNRIKRRQQKKELLDG